MTLVRIVVGAATVLIVLDGCAGAGPGMPSGFAPYDIGPAPRGAVREGGTLRLATGEFRTQWNYWHLGGPNLDAVTVLRTTLPWLFRSDANGAVRPNPDYLRRAGIVRTTPHQVVVYDINPKARWSDGTPIGYRDFRALWKAARGRNAAFPVATTTGYDRIRSVERGTRDRQVVVTFTRPFGEWAELFSPLYPAGTIGTPEAWNHAWLNRLPVTAGPFRPEHVDRTAQAVSVVRDPAWWGARAKLDRIVFRHLARDAMPGALLNGEIDGFDAGPDAAAYGRVMGAAEVSVRRAAGPDFTQLTFNGAGPILSDPDVRRAVAMAIDRPTVARSALHGLGGRMDVMNDHVYVNTQRGYQDNAGRVGAYDPAEARRLLDRAGWTPAGEARRKNGRTLTLRYVFPESATASRQSGELIQAMLRRVGVNLLLRPVPDGDFFDRYLLPGAYDVAPFTWHGTPFPIENLESVYARPRGGAVQQNVARIGSARLDRKLAQAVGELDPVRARRAANEADRLIWGEVHSLPLYQRPQIVPVRASLSNWGAFGLSDPVWTDIGFRK
ncbi:ABC transporter family substrate-binding protein [Actinoallomurus purpureus]|uniref:ABC transporter family substrate-binding protein n=1 Tax=Actinoallomurus purpureus TaxID=478114 RepID=UPI002093BEB4|nr:ABC transporter family substrate-binding protein [Actinoallomurus purpureus]MCO6006369.1 ABC transporter family substrate-binding protein [Actinoallomurus purpureus]